MSTSWFEKIPPSSNLHIDLSLFGVHNGVLVLKREDLLHLKVSGNKFRKLKYNVRQAKQLGYGQLLTFGGAFSNHIAAVAAMGKELGWKTVGVIRGEELIDKIDDNPTLQYAKKCGMNLYFVSREAYKGKAETSFLDMLEEKFGRCYCIPEGGTNALAVMGCEEVLSEIDHSFDYICTAVGTGATMAGLVNSSLPEQKVLGFSALKGTFQKNDMQKYLRKDNFEITDAYCFGGYAKIDGSLIRFINEFKEKTGIPLDPIYTGKMVFGIIDLLKKGKFNENSRILAIHTGGLQGIAGMNKKLSKKNLPQIIV